MSTEQPSYSPFYITSWTVLSILLGLGLYGMFVFNAELLDAGGAVWALIRWLASPFI